MITTLIAFCAVAVTGASSATARPAASSGWRWVASEHIKHYDPTDSGGLSCPAAHLCVAAAANKVVWSTDPDKASSWHDAALEPLHDPYLEGGTVGFYAIECPSTHFCAAVDNLGQVWTTTHPTGGKSAWQAVEVDDDTVAELTAISCADTSTCVALAYTGAAFTYANGTWSRTQLVGHQGADFYDASCPSATLCTAVEADGKIYTTNPQAGATWHHTKVGHVPGGWDSIACPTAHRCIAAGNYDVSGTIAVSKNPASGHWKTTKLSHADGFGEVRCHDSGFCFLSSGGGKDYYSTRPGSSAKAWHAITPPDSASQVELACPTTSECLDGTVSGKLRIGRRR